MLTIGSADEVLPVFSFEEEAEMFLGLGALGGSWQIRETTVGEIISVLYGPCVGVKQVALDPCPARVGGEAVLGLVSLPKDDFTRNLVDKKSRFSTLRQSLLPQEEVPVGSYPFKSLQERGL